MNEDKSISGQEGFVRLFSKYEGNVRAFVTSILPSWEGIDEVMQESSLIMWRKSDGFDYQGAESSFLNWPLLLPVMKF
jgi:DNA-directed RNA polymerase specialized sigma24 family protein